MYYLKHAIPEIDKARELVFVQLSGDPLYTTKLIEDSLYFCPEAKFSVKGRGEMPSNRPDFVFLLVTTDFLFKSKMAMYQYVRMYLRTCNTVVVYGIGTERTYILNKGNYKRWWRNLVLTVVCHDMLRFSPNTLFFRWLNRIRGVCRREK